MRQRSEFTCVQRSLKWNPKYWVSLPIQLARCFDVGNHVTSALPIHILHLGLVYNGGGGDNSDLVANKQQSRGSHPGWYLIINTVCTKIWDHLLLGWLTYQDMKSVISIFLHRLENKSKVVMTTNLFGMPLISRTKEERVVCITCNTITLIYLAMLFCFTWLVNV